METLRDHALATHFRLVQGIRAFPLSAVMDAMTDEQREAILQCFVLALDSGIHNFLYYLEQNADQYAEDGPERIMRGAGARAASDLVTNSQL